MVEMSSPEFAIQIVEADEKPRRTGGDFKPLTSGQLLLKTRHKVDHHRPLLSDGVDDEIEDDQDTGRECFLSKFLAASMTLLVCGFIYCVVLQRWLLTS